MKETTFDAFSSLINFIYDVPEYLPAAVTDETLFEILNLAEKYQVKRLVEELNEMFAKLPINNVCKDENPVNVSAETLTGSDGSDDHISVSDDSNSDSDHLSKVEPMSVCHAMLLESTSGAGSEQPVTAVVNMEQQQGEGPRLSTGADQPQQSSTMVVKEQEAEGANIDINTNSGVGHQQFRCTVTSDSGYSQSYGVICPISVDQSTLTRAVLQVPLEDPNFRGKIETIKIEKLSNGRLKTLP